MVEHCRRSPTAKILTWTDEVARTAGCTLNWPGWRIQLLVWRATVSGLITAAA